MGFDSAWYTCNADRGSEHIVMYDKQIYQIPSNSTLNAIRSVTKLMFY